MQSVCSRGRWTRLCRLVEVTVRDTFGGSFGWSGEGFRLLAVLLTCRVGKWNRVRCDHPSPRLLVIFGSPFPVLQCHWLINSDLPSSSTNVMPMPGTW